MKQLKIMKICNALVGLFFLYLLETIWNHSTWSCFKTKARSNTWLVASLDGQLIKKTRWRMPPVCPFLPPCASKTHWPVHKQLGPMENNASGYHLQAILLMWKMANVMHAWWLWWCVCCVAGCVGKVKIQKDFVLAATTFGGKAKYSNPKSNTASRMGC
jgi:hypothetical protein